ncbi:MAG: ribose-phosphate pyrophosphokinase [Elusimicrobiota bacterium]
MQGNLKLFTGTAHEQLSKEIADYLKVPLAQTHNSRFADGEIEIKVLENVRGFDCYILQPTCPPVNERLMELFIITDALRRASASRITVVLPYFGYARQDRKVLPRVPITAKLVSNLIVAAGANRVLTVDLHAGQIQGFFDIPVDNLYATDVVMEYFKSKNLTNIVIVSPDIGGAERARTVANQLNCDLAIIDKRRPKPNEASIMNIIGEIRGKNAIIIDDMVDTAGTLVKVAEALTKHGALSVYAACSHAVLSGRAIELIKNSPLIELVSTNSIPLNENKKIDKIKTISIAPLLGEAIRRIHNNESVSELFKR